ncbi:Ltp family lipoprotein [Companilactobacillus baiquanensis]|nr:Ltp family lipoprotein [Companilactobacillus baiquanensis]
MLYIFTIILFLSLTAGIFYLTHRINPLPKSIVSSALGITISVSISLIMSRTIMVFADSKFNPEPTIHLNSSRIKLKDTETSGIIKGKTLPNANVKLISKGKTIFQKEANKNGNFEIKGLPADSIFQLISYKNKKHSSKYKISIGEIPDSAITKFEFSNDSALYEVKSDKNNRAKVSGKTNPKSVIKIKNEDGKTLDTLKADKNGKWSITVDGPGTKKDSPNTIEYEFSSKSGKLKENNDNYLTVNKFKEKKKEPEKPVEDKKETSTPMESAPAPTPSAPAVPAEYYTALNNANDYLNYTAMSKKELYEQLTSQYGENFPADAAQYAIDHVKTDWNLQALKSAKSYQKNVHMSNNEIYEQLISEYGEQFEPAEANYAIQHLND